MNHLKITVDEEFRWRRILESQNSNLHSIVLVFLPIPTCRKSDLRCNSGQRSSSQRPSTWSQSIPQQESHGFNRSSHSLLVQKSPCVLWHLSKRSGNAHPTVVASHENPQKHGKTEVKFQNGETNWSDLHVPRSLQHDQIKHQTGENYPWATRNSWDNGCVGLQGHMIHTVESDTAEAHAETWSLWHRQVGTNFFEARGSAGYSGPNELGSEYPARSRASKKLCLTMSRPLSFSATSESPCALHTSRQIDHHRWRWHNTDQMPTKWWIFSWRTEWGPQ